MNWALILLNVNGFAPFEMMLIVLPAPPTSASLTPVVPMVTWPALV